MSHRVVSDDGPEPEERQNARECGSAIWRGVSDGSGKKGLTYLTSLCLDSASRFSSFIVEANATISSSAASIGSSETSIDGGVDLAKLSSCKGVREHNREKQLAHTSIR